MIKYVLNYLGRLLRGGGGGVAAAGGAGGGLLGVGFVVAVDVDEVVGDLPLARRQGGLVIACKGILCLKWDAELGLVHALMRCFIASSA